MHELVYTELALRDLADLDKPIAKRITDKLKFFSLQKDIRPFCKVLKGFRDRFRFRIGDYRAIFRIDPSGEIQILTILRVKHRKDIYDL